MSVDLPLIVLDTSALLSGLPPPNGFTLIVPPGVRGEIDVKGKSGRGFDYLLSAGLETRMPGASAVARVKEAATKTGDITKMSPADLEVVALALDLGCGLVSDDYRIQNVAAQLGVSAKPASQQGITTQWEWTFRCRGCARFFDAAPKRNECPVCGHEVRTVRKR